MPTPRTPSRYLQTAAALATLASSAASWAHEGHGLEGGHWHATDVWGLLAVAAVGAMYFYRRK